MALNVEQRQNSKHLEKRYKNYNPTLTPNTVREEPIQKIPHDIITNAISRITGNSDLLAAFSPYVSSDMNHYTYNTIKVYDWL